MQYLIKSAVPPKSLQKKKEKFIKDCTGQDPWAFYSKNKSKYDYRTSEIKNKLLKISENRCAICSRSIYDSNTLSNDCINAFTIEHIAPKDKNPSLIFEWDNMIPCCKACNNLRCDKEYVEGLYINPCKREDCGDLFGFLYDGSIYCNNDTYKNQVDYMIFLYNLNGDSKKNKIKYERKWYYKLLIDDKYQEIVKLNEEFGLSDNIIIFKDMFLFNKRWCQK